MIWRQQHAMAGSYGGPQHVDAATLHRDNAIHTAQVTPRGFLQQPGPPASAVGRHKYIRFVNDDVLHRLGSIGLYNAHGHPMTLGCARKAAGTLLVLFG